MSKLMPFDVVGVILEDLTILCDSCGDTSTKALRNLAITPIFRDTEGHQMYCEKCGEAIAHTALIED